MKEMFLYTNIENKYLLHLFSKSLQLPVRVVYNLPPLSIFRSIVYGSTEWEYVRFCESVLNLHGCDF